MTQVGELDLEKLQIEFDIASVGVIDWSNTNNTKAGLILDFATGTTQAQQTQAATIVTNHDPTTPINLVDCTVAGVHSVAFIRGSADVRFPLGYLADVTAISGITTFPTVSLGTNSPTYDNVLPATLLTAFNAVGIGRLVWLSGMQNAITSDIVLNCNVSLPALGASPVYKLLISALVINKSSISDEGVIAVS